MRKIFTKSHRFDKETLHIHNNFIHDVRKKSKKINLTDSDIVRAFWNSLDDKRMYRAGLKKVLGLLGKKGLVNRGKS